MNKSTPTQAVRDYNTYDKMYLKTNTNEVFTYVPKRSTTPEGSSYYYRHNTTNLNSALFTNNYVTKQYFYKASTYTGQVISLNLSEISNFKFGEYIGYNFTGGAYGTKTSVYIRFSIDGGTTSCGIDDAISNGYIDPVVLTCARYYSSVPSDLEYIYTGNFGSNVNYVPWWFLFKPLREDLTIVSCQKGSYSSSYDDGIYIYTTNIVEISTTEIPLDTAVNLNGEFNDESCNISLNWGSPVVEYASKLYLVKSIKHTPTSISDGELVFETDDVTVSEFLDENIRRNGTYYYTLFTVGVDGEIHPKSTSTKVEAAVKLKFRYIRDWLNGSTANNGNHWVEIEAYSNGTNVARGKSVSHSPNDNNTGGSNNKPTRVTDGDTNTSNYHEFHRTNEREAIWVQIDLAQEYDLEKINVRHYNGDGRTYYEARTEVSPDGNAWYTIFDSAISGVYAETSGGKNHTFNILDNK